MTLALSLVEVQIYGNSENVKKLKFQEPIKMKSTIRRWAEKIEFITATYLKNRTKSFMRPDKHKKILQVEKGYRAEHTVPGHLGNLASIESVFHIHANCTISSILWNYAIKQINQRRDEPICTKLYLKLNISTKQSR